MDINNVVLVGRAAKEPVARDANGTKVVDIPIATVRRFKRNGSDDLQEEVTYVDVTFWGKLAERAEKYIDKGTEFGIRGRLTQDKWETPEGEKRSRLKVTVDELSLGRRAGSGNNEQENSSGDDDGAPF